MKRLIVLHIFLSCFGFVFAQVTEPEKILRKHNIDTVIGWKTGAVISISATQSSFTNWAAGGQNSLGVNSIANLYANHKRKNSSWDNTLGLGYGSLRQGKSADWIKTDDKVDFASKYGQRASEEWFYAALINFKTQMDVGYNHPNDSVKISDFLSPAYLIGALGMDFKPNKDFSAFIAPITSKITIVNNQDLADAGGFGVEGAVYDDLGQIVKHGEKIRTEFGGYVKLAYQKEEIVKNINLATKIDLFSNYLENPKNIDVSWEVLIAMKVNKYITVTIATHLLYDDDINVGIDTNSDGEFDKFAPRTQYKQVIGVGLSYNFAK